MRQYAWRKMEINSRHKGSGWIHSIHILTTNMWGWISLYQPEAKKNGGAFYVVAPSSHLIVCVKVSDSKGQLVSILITILVTCVNQHTHERGATSHLYKKRHFGLGKIGNELGRNGYGFFPEVWRALYRMKIDVNSTRRLLYQIIDHA